MTDIDALIYECRALTNSGFGLCRSRAIDLLAALTAERAKVAKLRDEIKRLREVLQDIADLPRGCIRDDPDDVRDMARQALSPRRRP